MSENHTRKLVEVALPLDEINAACKADKDRKTGTIRNLHKWFAPAPLPAWRALLFAALVDDPQDEEKRAYLLDVIKRLVANGADLPDDDTLAEARRIIQAQFPDGVPTVMDPFCGGGSTLVEAQRLGLPTFGSDLNPVPVLITRTLTELLPKVYGQQPLHPEKVTEAGSGAKGKKARQSGDDLFGTDEVVAYHGYDGLIRDVTFFAEEVCKRVERAVAHLYPHQAGETPIAWLWARTATCPNPACGIETILTTSWWLSKKKGELAWIEPRIQDGKVTLDVISGRSHGAAPPPPKSSRGASFECLGCGQIVTEQALEEQGRTNGLGLRMICVVAEEGGRRIHRATTCVDEEPLASIRVPEWFPDMPVSDGGQRNRFGLDRQSDLYTPRQLTTLTAFADSLSEIGRKMREEGASNDWTKAVLSLLGLAVGRLALSNSSQSRVTIRNDGTTTRFNAAFGRNDLPVTWDFPEMNPLGVMGTWRTSLPTLLEALRFAAHSTGSASRLDARTARLSTPGLVATDPPYFDAIAYADLSDYFYVWHRRALREVHSDLYPTMATPKTSELTAIAAHHGGSKEEAREYFIEGFTETFMNLQESLREDLPMLVVYASKEQAAGRGEETRWESILNAMLTAGLEITGAWPIHMTSTRRMVGMGTNAVASYIVMVCRPRHSDAKTVSLMDFTRELRRQLPPAVLALQEASVLPVDLPQAVLGPGMSIFSRHRAVLDQSGDPISVGRAMQLISTALGEILDEQQGELDPASRFAVAWWESHGWESGPFGTADQLARPQGISVDDVVIAGVAESRGGKVHLVGNDNLDRAWQPSKDAHPTAWEAVHHLVDRLIDGGGVLEASGLLEKLGPLKDQAQTLAYRLESIAARKGWAKDQERYNALIGSWSDMLAAAARGTGSLEGLF